MPESTEKQLKALKLKIKSWETEFAKSNQRKPEKEDIHFASSDMKDTYKLYWALKNKSIMEKACKDDVWSEKFNKTYKENRKITPSCESLKKFCNKIRERSSVTNQTDAIDSSQNRRKSEPPIILKSESELGVENGGNAPSNCSILDFVNLEPELQIIKPNTKILKFNDIPKKVKAVSVLSTSVNLKNQKNKMSFETKIDSNWLERCNEDMSNTSCSNLDVPSTVSNLNQDISKSDADENSCLRIRCNDGESLPLHNNHEKRFSAHHNSIFDIESLQTNSSENGFTEQLPVTERNSHSLPFSQGETQFSASQQMTNELMSTQNQCENHRTLEQPYSSQANVNYSQVDVNSSHTQGDVNSSQTRADANTIVKNRGKLDIQDICQSKKRKLTRDPVNHKAASHLERKMAAGTLNENYVRVNIKKKKFSRGHRTVNVRKLKWKKWKDLKNSRKGEVNVSSPSACFKCGQIGHWARNCNAHTKDNQFSEANEEDIDDAPLPTLEEAADLAKKSKTNLLKVKAVNEFESQCLSGGNDESSILQKLCLDVEIERGDFSKENHSPESFKPLYEFAVDGKSNETPTEVFDALNELGYTSFRMGQEIAVMRILSGLSTLVVLPTGSGKSLCYQLPAYMYAKKFSCVTLVISPLVSLMEDQVTGLPSCLHAVCLHSGMTEIQKKASLQDLENRSAQILLVSPEAVISGLYYGFNLPPIAFACIDEAHCLSQWSHNFRPSYLQLHKVLTQRMNVKCILGLTATANLSTAKEITSHLGLQCTEESVVGTTGIPPNLYLSVSRDKDKDRALIQLLSGDRFSSCSSIIIYCIRRDETERLAALIRTCLQDHTVADEPPTKKRKSKSKKRNFLWTAEAYHAGLAPPRRRSIQKQFMSGKLRVVVATIAFGMGLDKRDVRAVMHYNMPKSFESYVQEIGRAGRDGLDAHCHLFLENEGKDMQELRRHIYSNSSDRHIIRKLLQKVFVPCKCKRSGEENSQLSEAMEMQDSLQSKFKCPKHEIAFSINDAVQELDLKEENILTFLCYLELHSKQWIEVLPPTYATCTIRCYGGPKQLRNLASKSAPVAAAFAIGTKKGRHLENVSTYEFAVVEVASFMGWNSGSVKRELKNLEWNEQKRKTGVIIGFSDLAFHLNAPGNLSNDELDGVLDYLHEKVNDSEKLELHNLKSLFTIFTKYSHDHYWACTDEASIEFSEGIKGAINKYFEETEIFENIGGSQTEMKDNADVDVSYIRSQIRDIIYTNNDQNFTGRAIARIFHGIGSPCYPAEVWGKVRKFWRCSLHVDFNLLIKLANDELKKSK